MEWSVLDARDPRSKHLMQTLLDELEAAPVTPLLLPLPADARALSVARRILADPARPETLDALSHQHGASRRTLERLFRNETGMSFGFTPRHLLQQS